MPTPTAGDPPRNESRDIRRGAAARGELLSALALFLTPLAPLPLAAQQPSAPAPVYPAEFNTPMQLYTSGLGPYTRRITTASAEAQAFFDQGMQLLFSFTPRDAARSFREAQRLDPQCAMCFWGEALAWGPYLNGGMARDDAPRAFAAIGRAKELASRANTTERAFIEALGVRYAPTHDAPSRVRMDSAYANAMERVWRDHPADLDAGTLYAEALMLLQPRRGNWDVEKPEVQRIHSVLDAVLTRDIMHPGACHLYIHATESTVRPEKAEACAEHLGHSIPGASHINHMPSHTFNRVGRWGDAVRANIEAWHSDLKAEIGEGFAIYPSHNLHMLLYSASYDGQGAIAAQAARDYAKITRGGSFYSVLTLVRFGRFDEVLGVREIPQNPIQRALWEFGRGYAHLRLRNADSAQFYSARVDTAARILGDTANFRGHTANDLLGIVGRILRAELVATDGRRDDAIALLEEAVRIEDGLRYDEPEPLPFTARHWLGALQLEAGRSADAERTYRADLERHPHNGWSLVGLEQALRNQGRGTEADEVRTAFARTWVRSDTWIRASRF